MEGATPFPGLLHFTFDPHLIVLSVKQKSIKNHWRTLYSLGQWPVFLICINSMSIVFVHTQLNVKTVLFQTIQFSISTVSMPKTVLFQTVQFNISTQFSSTWPIEQWQGRSTPLFPKILYYWNLTIRLFSVILRTKIGESYPSAEMQSVYSTAPADCAKWILVWAYTIW